MKGREEKFGINQPIQLPRATSLLDVPGAMQIGNINSVLIAGHGLLVFGKTVHKAKVELIALERMLKLEYLKRSSKPLSFFVLTLQ